MTINGDFTFSLISSTQLRTGKKGRKSGFEAHWTHTRDCHPLFQLHFFPNWKYLIFDGHKEPKLVLGAHAFVCVSPLTQALIALHPDRRRGDEAVGRSSGGWDRGLLLFLFAFLWLLRVLIVLIHLWLLYRKKRRKTADSTSCQFELWTFIFTLCKQCVYIRVLVCIMCVCVSVTLTFRLQFLQTWFDHRQIGCLGDRCHGGLLGGDAFRVGFGGGQGFIWVLYGLTAT